MLAFHTATRTDQDGVRFDLQVSPFTEVALDLGTWPSPSPRIRLRSLPDGLVEVYPVTALGAAGRMLSSLARHAPELGLELLLVQDPGVPQPLQVVEQALLVHHR